jgi:DNA-binding GntR family transcriptional regulator
MLYDARYFHARLYTYTMTGRPALNARTPLVRDVIEYIRDLIVSGVVHADEFLRLDAIAESLGTSVTPVREALLQLRGEGFVEWEPRRGFRVVRLTPEDIQDIHLVQAFIARELATRASRRMSTYDVEGLQAIQQSLEEAHARGDAQQVEELNHAFHRTINLAADSPKLAWALKNFARFAPRRYFAQVDGWAEASAKDHRAIISALMSRDADSAGKAMQLHVENAGRLLAAHHAQVSASHPS